MGVYLEIFQTFSGLPGLINFKHKYFLLGKKAYFRYLLFTLMKCTFSETIVFGQFTGSSFLYNILISMRKYVVLEIW